MLRRRYCTRSYLMVIARVLRVVRIWILPWHIRHMTWSDNGRRGEHLGRGCLKSIGALALPSRPQAHCRRRHCTHARRSPAEHSLVAMAVPAVVALVAALVAVALPGAVEGESMAAPVAADDRITSLPGIPAAFNQSLYAGTLAINGSGPGGTSDESNRPGGNLFYCLCESKSESHHLRRDLFTFNSAPASALSHPKPPLRMACPITKIGSRAD